MKPHWEPDPTAKKAAEGLMQTLSQDLALEEGGQQREVLARLKDLQTRLAASPQAGLAGLCTVGVNLMEHLRVNAVLGPDDIRNLLKEVICQLHGALSWTNSSEAKETRSTPNDVVRAALKSVNDEKNAARLNLCDGQRLGELLITMSMLKPAQVQEALEVQKRRGLKLGDALVEMKILTREMVQSALRVQKQRRTNGADAWASR
jgi:hypothetical protein